MFNNRRNNNNAFAALSGQLNRTDVQFGPPGINKTFSTTSPLSSPLAGPGGEIEAARRRPYRARQAEQRVENAGRYGTAGSFLGGLGGAALTGMLTPVLGPFAAILGPAAGSAIGGGLGQLMGGVTPDFGDILGYGASGALGGIAGQGLGQAFGQAATGGVNSAVQYASGQGVLGGLGNAFDLNTTYDPRYRYYYDTNTQDIQSAYSLLGDRRYA